ncbi:MAG: WecB/TagA/CpsF family glycosyltransferase [Actinomycetota bacterium]|nr:WecB/TagA/CpsF family glycosyltransferase [Actinomycetota bacterium]
MTSPSQDGKLQLFGVGINATTYDEATAAIIEAAKQGRSFGLSALATHGLMYAVASPEFAQVLNRLDMVTPDGQPVRWAMNTLLGTQLTDRVYGPTLADRVCAAAAEEGLPLYLFGSTPHTSSLLVDALTRRYPSLIVAGAQPDRFREATPEEDREDVERIGGSGAQVVLVGRGCPRQERWVDAHKGEIAAPMLAVGAAFDYLAGTLRPPPAWMQDRGLEWLHRLWLEPRRLWRRYLYSNTMFLVYFAREWLQQRRHKREAP